MCDFEAEDLCGFEQSQGDSFDWVRGTSNDHASLPLDHTTNNASGRYFLFLISFLSLFFYILNDFWCIFFSLFYTLEYGCLLFVLRKRLALTDLSTYNCSFYSYPERLS